MKNNGYEGLLPIDPIGAFNKIKENYVRYFQTVYRFNDRYKYLNDQKERLLTSNDNLYKTPYMELLPEYVSVGKSLNEIICSDEYKELRDALPPGFTDFIHTGLMSYPPYKHQVEMLKKGFADKHNVVIKSGTGSGKTESFMLPLIASLLKEASGWSRSDYDKNWYEATATDNDGNNTNIYEPSQRLGEADDRQPAIRALIMYPMNALVADQMTRLRKTLDCKEIREFLNRKYKGNRLFFGRYVGETMNGTSIPSEGEDNEVVAFVKESISLSKKYVDNNWQDDDSKKDAIYIKYRHPSDANEDKFSAEMFTRADMKKWAPDILITNYSMLSIMMMRNQDSDIFYQTNRWYQAIDVPEKDREEAKANRIFHLILDELHLYRGTSGTEVAYLMRMFLERIGVPPVLDDGRINPQLRIYASSASLGNDEETHSFLEQFFGVPSSPANPNFDIISGEQFAPADDLGSFDHYSDFAIFAQKNNKGEVAFIVGDDAEKQRIRAQFCNAVGTTKISSFVVKHANQIYADLVSVMQTRTDTDGNNFLVPTSIKDVIDALFGGSDEAFRGFLIFRADTEVCSCLNDFVKLPRVRFHQFFKYIEGLWGELQPAGQPPIGKLMYKPEEVVIQQEENGEQSVHKVLELLRCECCGDLFVGGNRRYTGTVHTDFDMSLNSPELNKIPNRNPTPMVQNKVYSKYAIFWPSEIYEGREPGVVPHAIDAKTLTPTTTEEEWKEAFLNPYDGSVTIRTATTQQGDRIHGYVYFVDSAVETMALPVQCPHCRQNYEKRKYSKSPIRSFRSGMKRNNQILSKELLYQLPISEDSSTKDRKLIGFSDSRQDAAEQAHGIAVEHYRDMVRMALMECVSEKQTTPELEQFKTNVRSMGYFPGAVNMIQPNSPIYPLVPEITRLLNGGLTQEFDELGFEMENVPLKNFLYNGATLEGPMIKKLLKLGINPMGVKAGDQNYYTNGVAKFWTDAYKFNELRGCVNSDQGVDATTMTYLGCVEDQLIPAIFQNCFGRYMGLNTEDAGLGYIVLTEGAWKSSNAFTNFSNELRRYQGFTQATDDECVDFINAYIRILGDFYRYKSEYTPVDITSYGHGSYKVAMKKCLREITGGNDANLGQYLYNVISLALGNQQLILDYRALSFHRVKNNAHYYKCPKCGRIHLHRGMGICTNTFCCEPLVEAMDQTGTILEVENLHQNYISYDILKEKRDACRMHTEELTGQTDDQTTRLLEFKGIILDENAKHPLGAEIDMVNVTTTMEVGVDIGSLLAVFQGNMPPTRYNYQQRVGRGGRRGQAFSAAVTFCRGKSHDEYYYTEATEEMLGSIPASPKLSVKPVGNRFNDTIVKRMIAKAVLREAFIYTINKILSLNPDYSFTDLVPQGITDTHGQFGYAEKWNWIIPESNREFNSYPKEWLTDPTNHDRIVQLVRTFIKQYDNDRKTFENDLVDWVEKKLFGLMDAAITNGTSVGVAQRLAEAGILPMYGMPSNVRVLYHGSKNQHIRDFNRIGAKDCFDTLEIDRPLEQAITEFAPGSQRMKDHGYYTSAGLTIPFASLSPSIENESDEEKKHYDALEFSHTMQLDADGNIIDISTGAPDAPDDTHIQLVIPKAFRTKQVYENKGEQDQNTDRRSFSQSKLWVKNTDPTIPSVEFGNVKVDFWDCSVDDKPNIWYVNDNNSSLFPGYKEALTKMKRVGRGNHAPGTYLTEPYISILPITDGFDISALAPNFMISDIPNRRSDNRYYNRQPNSTLELLKSNEVKEIALGAVKQTELIRLMIPADEVPKELNLSLAEDGGAYIPAVKAAYYSAATLIQRVFADEVDITPDEIEISEVQKDADGTPYIYLFDQLQNGSGYVKMLLDIEPDTGMTKLEHIMRDIVAGGCDNSIPNNKGRRFLQMIMSKSHASKCHTACSKCIRTYQNSGYHHVLDWRLGVDLIKLMLDKNYVMGYDDLNNTPYGDLNSLMGIYCSDVSKAHNGVSYDKSQGKYRLVRTGLIRSTEDVVHPLWRHDKDHAQNLFELIRVTYQQKGHLVNAPLNQRPINTQTTNSLAQQPTQQQTQTRVDPTTGITRGVSL